MLASEVASERGFRGLVEKCMPPWKSVIFKDPCPYCEGPSNSKEHVSPRSHGGRINECNTVGACAKCNSLRRSAPFLVWLAYKRRLLVNPKGSLMVWEELSPYLRTGTDPDHGGT